MWADFALRLQGIDHGKADAVLNRGQRVEELALSGDVGLHAVRRGQLGQAHERGCADGLQDALVNLPAELAARLWGGDFDGLALDIQRAGPVAQFLDSHGIKALHDLALHIDPERAHHLEPDVRAVALAGRVACAFQIAHDADDLAHGDASALARQAVAAARAALAGEDVLVHQLLEHLFQITPRDALTPGDIGRAHWPGAGVIGDVDDGLDGE